jgi:hypothetical protein
VILFTSVAVTPWSLSKPTDAAVTTRRLGTGLHPTRSVGVLPQTWVAPVTEAPRVDGKLGEAVWDVAPPVLLGKLTTRGKTWPRTEARFVHRAGLLYAAVRLDEPNVDRIKRAAMGPDGPGWEDDSVELFLSPEPESGYYQFIFSAAGGIFDRQGHGDPAGFNAGARAAVQIGEKGWTLEAAIPMRALGVGDSPPAAWRANIYRNRQAGPEGANQAWSPTLRPDYDVPERFGYLLFTPKSPWAEEAEGTRLSGITVQELDGGTALLFDLSDLPAGTKVHRARLLCERTRPEPSDPQAMDSIEILPMAGTFEEGKTPRTESQSLPLAEPWFRSFDVTEHARRWVGRDDGGVLVKRLPGWQIEKTYLDLMYEGEPGDVPQQVTGVTAFHRAGQTFITWNEVDLLIRDDRPTWGQIREALADGHNACRYRIYAHPGPIDARTIAEATLLAEVEPLSGYNTNGRNLEYLISQAMIEPDEMGELARDYNGYMYTWGMNHPRMDRFCVDRFVIDVQRGRLPAGTGLYVHSPNSGGRRYYAVVSCIRGVENTAKFSSANTTGAIQETVGPGRPVHQGPGLWGPYFDYPGQRQVYVQWCAPPLAPLPSMYFNWSVLVPPEKVGWDSVPTHQGKSDFVRTDSGQSPKLRSAGKFPVEMYFHAGNFSYAKPRKKYMAGSIQIAPHDYPFSGWYGLNDAYGTLKSWREGTVSNHTQKRFVAFLDWAKDELPLDPDRIVLCGSDGAAALAMNYRDVFAYALIGGFGGRGEVQGRVLDPDQQDLFASAWGPKSPEIADEHGRTNWDWAMLDKLARERPGQSMPLVICVGTSWGGVRQYGKAFGPYYTAMQEMGQPLIAGHGWDKQLITPDWYTGQWQPRRGIAAEELDLTRKTPIPAFANASTTHEKLQSGNTNWNHTWHDVQDEPGRFQITLAGVGTVDMTPRRLQQFRTKPGQRLTWRAEPIPHPRDQEPPPAQSGTVTVDKRGLITLRGLKIPQGGLAVEISR